MMAGEAASSETSSSGLQDPGMSLEKIQDLLKVKDDTSRFVGLALLKAVLDNQNAKLNSKQVNFLFEAISPKFLDRLLRAQSSQHVDKAEAKNMVDLAVAILHTFSIILPEDARKDQRLTGRIEALVKALVNSSPETANRILQTLLTIVSQVEGALELLKIKDLSPLVELAAQHSLVLDILSFSLSNASTIPAEAPKVQQKINSLIPTLLLVFKGTDAVTLLKLVANILRQLAPETLPQEPKWLGALVILLRDLVTKKPTMAGRTAYTELAAALLQTYPATCPSLLFGESALNPIGTKPFSYLLINLLLIDLQSCFPDLLSKLNSPEYPVISQRLAAAFDIISSFIGYLVRCLDDENSSSTFNIPPDFLLKLRRDIAQTMSLSIEFMRDRWDASIAGASGLHPSARTGTAVTSQGSRLTLTWESMKDDVSADPLILAGIRTLAIWIREDENENLRNESAGLMDMFVELYKLGSGGALDFRYPILLALEGIMGTEDGIAALLRNEGWEVLSKDLESILKSGLSSLLASSDTARGMQIVRVLLAIVDDASSLQESWMSLVTLTASLKAPSSSSPPLVIELHIAMLQISVALLGIASGGMQKIYITSYAAISGLAQQMKTVVDVMDDKSEAADFKGLLDDVFLDLENLGIA